MGSFCVRGTKLQFGKKSILEKDSGDGCTAMRMSLMPLNCVLKMENFTLCMSLVLALLCHSAALAFFRCCFHVLKSRLDWKQWSLLALWLMLEFCDTCIPWMHYRRTPMTLLSCLTILLSCPDRTEKGTERNILGTQSKYPQVPRARHVGSVRSSK